MATHAWIFAREDELIEANRTANEIQHELMAESFVFDGVLNPHNHETWEALVANAATLRDSLNNLIARHKRLRLGK